MTILRDELGEESELLWILAFYNYELLALERRWPKLSQGALSMELKAAGCTVRQRDRNRQGRGRPRVLRWARPETRPLPMQLHLPFDG